MSANSDMEDGEVVELPEDENDLRHKLKRYTVGSRPLIEICCKIYLYGVGVPR